jgi:hypothetical protein
VGFWSKLGKGALKVGKIAAPIALAATGVGIPAAIAVKGGLDALDHKVNGGSWKGALGAGALGAATGAIPGGAIAGIAKGAAGSVGGEVAKQGIGSILKDVGKNVAVNAGTALVNGKLGEVAGGVAAGRADGRKEAADVNMRRDGLNLIAERDLQQALLERAKLEMQQKDMVRDSRGQDARDAMRGALMKNVKDVSMNRPSGVPMMQFSGGLRPSAMGEGGRQAGELLEQQALASMLQGGDKFTTLPELKKTELTALPEANFWDQLLNGTSQASLFAKALGLDAIGSGPGQPGAPPPPVVPTTPGASGIALPGEQAGTPAIPERVGRFNPNFKFQFGGK